MSLFKHKAKERSYGLDFDRAKAAIENLSARLMITDNDRVILYANPAVVNFLKSVEQDIKQHLPNFSANNLVGVNIDSFHKNPSHQQSMLSKLTEAYDTSIRIGVHLFNLRATPLSNENGDRIGTQVEWFDSEAFDNAGQVKAIGRSQAVIHFQMDGTIISANENFLKTMGYSLEEIKGKHHSIFADTQYANSAEYRDFWAALNRGEYSSGEIRRFGKGGREIWLQASYNPILDNKGKPFKVVKYASDITEQKRAAADVAGQLEAINKSQAVIEFNLDGTIITANPNFLNTMGYSLAEVKSHHHSMFVDPAESHLPQYKAFWEKLGRGEFDANVYKRIGKGGREIWIQASYNPIFDPSGKPYKVVKYATDVTSTIETVRTAEASVANLSAIAAAVEEMTAAVAEISKNMNSSRDAAIGIQKESIDSSSAANQLGSKMESMNNVVQVINNIAGQVNLLALNATIEAARAGEAGKGFAVVASEVKNLATQTAKATEDITSQIKDIQTSTVAVVTNISNIEKSASNVSEYVTSVSSAIEEQTAVTREISMNVQKLTTSMQSITERNKTA